MNTLAFIGFALVALVAIGWSAWDFLRNLTHFIAPDNADERAIGRTFGATPQGEKALNRRFGPGRNWRDAITGLSGLMGILYLGWILFG